MVFVLYRGTIQFYVERDWILTRLSAIISHYLTKFMKHDKSNTAFLHEIVNIFSLISAIYLSEVTYVISSFILMTKLQELIPYATNIPWIYRSPWGKTIYEAFINNADCPKRYSFDGHPSTCKFLVVKELFLNGIQASSL